MSKIHHISGLNDLATASTKENIDRLLADLKYALIAFESMNKILEAGGQEKLRFDSFNWCDDHMNKITSINIFDKQGNTLVIEPKDRNA